MAEVLYIHPDNPQPRLLKQAVACLQAGGLLVYPTDAGYALACQMGNKEALTRLRRIRGLDDKHYLTLVCRDLAALGQYGRVENNCFRLLKKLTPGPYTFLLQATKEVPRRLLDPKRKIIGIRVPDNQVAQALLAMMGEPILSSSLLLPGESEPLADPMEIFMTWEKLVDMVLDSGMGESTQTTVIAMDAGEPKLVRAGKGAQKISE